MDFRIQMKTLELLTKLLSGNTEKINLVNYEPQKEKFLFSEKGSSLQRSTPEEQGIRSRELSELLTALMKNKEVNLHGIMILKNGKVIAEGAVAPYQKEVWHISHSLCKSITGTAIGFAVSEGILGLDEKVKDIFKKHINILFNFRLKNLTVRHLLIMSSGIVFNETGAVTSNDWIKEYLESALNFEPGREFAYNSMNTFMLSAIIKEKTGQDLTEYLKKRLFEPLGITSFYWEKSPLGIEKGGWGLSMTMEDMAKIGQLYLQNGTWNGKQIIPASWIEQSTAKQIETDKIPDTYGYGYQIWRGKRKGSYQFNGMLGQNVVVYPDLNMVVVTTAGNTEFFLNGQMQKIIDGFFADRRPDENGILQEDTAEYLRLCWIQEHLKNIKEESKKNRIRIQGGWDSQKAKGKKKGKFVRKRIFNVKPIQILYPYLGREYKFAKNAVGIMPVFIQCIHNNYGKGISAMRLLYKNSQHFLEVEEGDNFHRIPFGIEEPAYGSLVVNGESYMIGTQTILTTNEDDVLVLKLEISFIETSNSRIIKLFLQENEVLVRFDERPGMNFLIEAAGTMIGKSAEYSITDTEYLQFKMNRLMTPCLQGYDKEKTKEVNK